MLETLHGVKKLVLVPNLLRIYIPLWVDLASSVLEICFCPEDSRLCFLFSVIVPLSSNFDDLSSYEDEPISNYAF